MGSANKKIYWVVYKITNLLNKMIYIGVRHTKTPYDLKNYWSSSKHLKASIKKHGKENYTRETLFVYETPEEAYAKEKEIVDTEFVARKDTYNHCGGGKGTGSGESHPMYGTHHSDEAKAKIGAIHRGKVMSKESRAKMSEAHIGEKNYNYGKTGKASPQYGRTPSLATKEKIRQGNLGRVVSKEMKEKLRLLNLGRVVSEETKKKLRGKNHQGYGKHRTKATKKKISIAKLGEEKYYQRLKDVEEIEKVWGWKSKLARKWGVVYGVAFRFMERNCPEYLSD